MSFEPPPLEQWSPRRRLATILLMGCACWVVVLLVIAAVFGALKPE
jgi:hypothetical protein